MRRAPRRAENDITARATLTFAEADAITYDWVDANGNSQNSKITEPATTPEQIAYLLGTSYMNPNIPGIKYSAVYNMDNPYPNIEFGWDIPNNDRWPSEFVGTGSGTSTTVTQTWSWVGATMGTTLPDGWTLTDPTYSALNANGDGTWYIGVDSQGNATAQSITIPANVFVGYTISSVVIRAKIDDGYSGKTISVNGDAKTLTNTLANYTWTNVDASNGILIEPTDGYVGFASITITGTKTTTTATGGGLTIATPVGIIFKSITVKNQNGTTLTSWNPTTAINNNQYNGYSTDDGTQYYYTIPDWTCSSYFYLYAEDDSGSSYIGYLVDNHIHIPASLLTGSTSVTVTINAYGFEGGEVLVVNGEEKTVTTSAANYTWTITDFSSSTNSVIPPYDNGYTVFLVKVNDNVPAAMNPEFTYSWNNGTTSLLTFFDTYIDEVQLLTDGTRLNENTDDAGTMFAYSGELGRFYFLGKGNSFWWGSSEADTDPHLAPTYDMYEEFSPTSTDNGADITDFYSKLLYGNSYNVIHDCRGMNYFQHYFTMSGLAGDEHRSMTNLIFWIPDNRNAYHDRNYNEEYLPHVGLYTIWLEAEAERAADYSTTNRMYDVTLDWVSSLNSILDFDVDQDYELWVYIYDDQGNPIADYMVLDRLQMQDVLIHNNTTFTYQVEQQAESQTIIYRVKGWPKDASNTPGNYPNDAEKGNFFALSNLDPVIIPGYNDFLQLGVEHYESDFAINVEHNYYRNFLTVTNQDEDNNPLTAARIENGESQYELYRYDATDLLNPKDKIKAADLTFSVEDNKVKYLINYSDQQYIDEANLYNEYNHANLTGYTDPAALGCPTSGEIAAISEGGGTIDPITYNDITIKPTGTATNFYSILVKSDENSEIVQWTTSMGRTLPTGLTCSSTWNYYSSYGGYTNGTLTVDGTLLTGMTNVQVVLNAYGDSGGTRTITVNGVSQTIQNGSNNAADYTWNITPSGSSSVFTLLNDFLNNSTYTQVGQVVFELPWKSIQVKLQDESAGTSSGYFLIQNNGKLRFIMPAGYNNANLKFVIHNAPVTSNYYDGTFKLTSSTGATQTITIPSGGTYVDGDKDYDVIFEHISSGDVITITGTHTVEGTVYNYSPDFTYIKVYVLGGTGGISENDGLNLDAVKFVDQFRAPTDKDMHPYRYGYVLQLKNNQNVKSGEPKIPVQHTNSKLDGFYTLSEIQNDTEAPLLPVNVMNAEVNMTLSREPEIYYFTLDRKPNTAQSWEELSKLQRREDDSYQEMYDQLPEYDNQVSNPPAVTTPPTPWIVERYDNYDVMQGGYNDYMNYVPIIWTHGDQKNRRVKWNTENRHNSYGAPIWKTGVADVKLMSAIAQRQDDPSTKWTYGGENCSLYMLDNIEAVAKMPTANNVNYVPYMFRIFVKSERNKLRGYTLVAEGADPSLPGEHYVGAPINDDELQCVWSGYVNDPNNENYGVSIGQDDDNGTVTITFHKDKVDRTLPAGDWDKNQENAIFASIEDLIQTDGEGNPYIDGHDLMIIVRFYYLVEGFNASAPGSRDGGDGPAGYGAEGEGFTPGPSTAVNEIGFNCMIESVTYVNAQGLTSDKPFDGINIVITRYTNGMTRTTKVIR